MSTDGPPAAALRALRDLALPDPPVGPPRHLFLRAPLGDRADTLLDAIIAREPDFFDNDPGRLGYRRGRALSDAPELTGPVAEVVRGQLDAWCDAFDIDVGSSPASDVLELSDLAVTAIGDGDFLSQHRDDGRLSGPNGRMVSFVYWMHRRPKAFTGAELRLCGWLRDGDALIPGPPATDLVPEHDVLVAFPSSTMHEVFPAHSESTRFADSRFTVTGFVRRRNGPS